MNDAPWQPPPLPRTWYLGALSREIAPGTIRRIDVGGIQATLFRAEGGAAHAIGAFCGHLGASLANGTVRGERVRCPLHHFEYGSDGACAVGFGAPIARYPVAEGAGLVLVHAGEVPVVGPPPLVRDGALRATHAARPARLACSWYAAVVNAFDLHHLETVHQRRLVEPATLDRPDPYTLRLTYTAEVTGSGPADRVVRGLARGPVRVTVACHGGTAVWVSSVIGAHCGELLVMLTPRGAEVEVVPVAAVAVKGNALAAGVRARIAAWLYRSFLARDVRTLEGMRFRPPPANAADSAILECIDFLASLPKIEQNC